MACCCWDIWTYFIYILSPLSLCVFASPSLFFPHRLHSRHWRGRVSECGSHDKQDLDPTKFPPPPHCGEAGRGNCFLVARLVRNLNYPKKRDVSGERNGVSTFVSPERTNTRASSIQRHVTRLHYTHKGSLSRTIHTERDGSNSVTVTHLRSARPQFPPCHGNAPLLLPEPYSYSSSSLERVAYFAFYRKWHWRRGGYRGRFLEKRLRRPRFFPRRTTPSYGPQTESIS